jgi:hypothetical protein
MHRHNTLRRLPLPAPLRWMAAAAALVAGSAMAADPPAGGAYVLTKQAIAGGGGRASGGSYVLVATVGQSVAGQADAEPYVDQQGFHAGIAPQPDGLFADNFEDFQ